MLVCICTNIVDFFFFCTIHKFIRVIFRVDLVKFGAYAIMHLLVCMLMCSFTLTVWRNKQKMWRYFYMHFITISTCVK